MVTPIRVGAVSYLNAKPLYYRLGERSARVELSMDLPSRLASRLGPVDQVTLHEVATCGGKDFKLVLGFHALGEHRQS